MSELKRPVAVAGATGQLGKLIATELRRRGAEVRALVRPGTHSDRLAPLRALGVEVREVELAAKNELTEALKNCRCVVSALSGLEDVIVTGQKNLLEAAVEAGVPRFIPSDFSIDYTRLPYGTNRNLDLRKTFRAHAEAADIGVTSVLNGMFTDLLLGEAPLILPRFRRVIYWGRKDQPLDFTSMRDTASYTAAAAMDPDAPRWLRVSGNTLSAEGLARAASDAYGQAYTCQWVGTVGVLTAMIDATRIFVPGREEVFPPWQGMQYLRNMFSGRGKLVTLNNDRYPDIRWQTVAEVLRNGKLTSEN